jgi:tripartite ATP-independent transporter DctP family solute receptor
MFKRRAIASVIASAALLVATSSFAQYAERTIKWTNGVNEDHSVNVGVKRMQEVLNAKTGGKIKINAFWNNAAGGDLAGAQAARAGTQEIVCTSGSALTGIVKELGVLDLPFLFNSEQEAYTVLDGPMGKYLNKKLEDAGLINLGYWENGFRNLTNSKRPVTKVEDLDGIKLRVMQNNVFLNSFKTLGANAVPMAFSELFGALETKTVDGQENPYNTILSSKFYEVQKYLTVTNHVYSPWIVLVSKKWWDQLSKVEQKVLMDAAKTSREFERKDTREEASKAMADLKSKGMLVNELSPAEAARMRNKLTGVYAQIGTEVGMDLWNETQKELSRIRGGK